jgi:outer membrane receptor for ferrienterochelin and colicin
MGQPIHFLYTMIKSTLLLLLLVTMESCVAYHNLEIESGKVTHSDTDTCNTNTTLTSERETETAKLVFYKKMISVTHNGVVSWYRIYNFHWYGDYMHYAVSPKVNGEYTNEFQINPSDTKILHIRPGKRDLYDSLIVK